MRRVWTVMMVGLGVAFGGAGSVSAQDVAVSRMAWGAPDLSGVWDFRTITPLERPAELADKEVLTAEEAAAFTQQAIEGRNADRRDGGARRDVERAYNDFWWDWGNDLTDDRRTSLIVDPADGRIPALTPEAEMWQRAQRDAGVRPVRAPVLIGSPAHGPEDLGLSERCMLGFNSGPPMLPSAYNNNVQLFQTPDHVVIFNEMIHEPRIVPLDRRPALPDTMRQWIGDARGYWDGDTLVVESDNYTDKTGSFYTIVTSYGSGETLHLVERFTRVDDDTLLYEFTVDDPDTFVASLTAAIPMQRTDGPLFEYACHEGNYGMTNLLTGARVQEAEKDGQYGPVDNQSIRGRESDHVGWGDHARGGHHHDGQRYLTYDKNPAPVSSGRPGGTWPPLRRGPIRSMRTDSVGASPARTAVARATAQVNRMTTALMRTMSIRGR
ncbi:MAG: hypothetical protein VYE68_10135 [Acidobacteriota bacterium]|nr:hypothetical protein [Acidobacteriota bacterium]